MAQLSAEIGDQRRNLAQRNAAQKALDQFDRGVGGFFIPGDRRPHADDQGRTFGAFDSGMIHQAAAYAQRIKRIARLGIKIEQPQDILLPDHRDQIVDR